MRLLLACLALALSACTPALDGLPLKPPAPLAETAIDEKGLIVTYRAFDALLTAVDTLIAVKAIVPGSPAALKVKGLIGTAATALDAASAARRAGSAADYATAMAEARDAFGAIRTLIKGE